MASDDRREPRGARYERPSRAKAPRLRPDEDYGVDERHRDHPDEAAYLHDLYVHPKGPNQ